MWIRLGVEKPTQCGVQCPIPTLTCHPLRTVALHRASLSGYLLAFARYKLAGSLAIGAPLFLIITVIALWTVCFAACHSYVPPAISCCLLLLLLIFGKVVVLSSPSSCLTKVNVPCPMQEEEKNTDKQLWYQCRCSFLEVLQVPQRNCRQFICIDKWYPWQADWLLLWQIHKTPNIIFTHRDSCCSEFLLESYT